MKQRRTVAAAACVLALLVGGCSTDGSGSDAPPTPLTKGGLLTVYSPVDPVASGWDPATADSRIQRVMGPEVMATLLRPDLGSGAPTPWLAESATADAAATTWTIKLRSGLTFSDGAPLAARDFAFALTAAADQPNLATRFGADANGTFFESARATDDVTLVVSLRAPNALLDRLVLAAPEFGCVKDGYAGTDRDAYFDAPASCGPFLVGSTDPASPSTVRLERNPRYVLADEVLPDAVAVGSSNAVRRVADIVLDAPSPGTPFTTPRTPAATTAPPTVELPTASDAPTETASTAAVPTESATVTGAPTTPAASTPAATTPATSAPRTAAPARIWTADELVASAPATTTMLVLRAQPPTRDQNLRLALRALPDLEALAAVSPGAVPATTGLAPVGFNGAFEVPAAGGRADIATTAIGLVPEDARTVAVLVDGNDPIAMQTAQLLVAQAASVGLTIELNVRSRVQFAERLATGRFEAALASVAPTVADAVEVPRLWAVTNAFGSGWPTSLGSEAYASAVGAPAHGEASVAAAAGFENTIRTEVYAVPLVADVHRIGNATGVPGAAVGLVGNVPFERFAPAERQSR